MFFCKKIMAKKRSIERVNKLNLKHMNRVTHFEIQVDNIERAKKFYEQALGWKITTAMSKEKDGMNYWTVMTGEGAPGINGGMYERPPEKMDQFYTYDCTIGVSDIDKAIAAVQANGGTITKGKGEIPKVGWFAGAKDSEGNRFGLIQMNEAMKG